MHSEPSPWMKHVMKVMKDNKISLKEAMKLASATYRMKLAYRR